METVIQYWLSFKNCNRKICVHSIKSKKMTVSESMKSFRLYPCEVLPPMNTSRPITVDEACALKLLLFGNLKDSFGFAWREQSFHFRAVPPYGFHQKGPGPCGVLAAVQAYVIHELFFGVFDITRTLELLKLKTSQKSEALAQAIAKILWQAGDGNSAIICRRGDNIVFDTDEAPDILKRDGILEYLHIQYFDCEGCMADYIINYISEMTTDGRGGCILFLYSVLLTRGIENIKKEMDDPESHLIGTDGYCSQEIINLILIGKAVPNLFDGDMELNSGGSETTLHHGIPGQSNFGLLSLYDYNDTSPVGNYYKKPIYPIWVLLGESHFTILFAKSNFQSRSCFTLYHYDGLARTHAETAYLIKPYENVSPPPKDKSLPIAVRCIHTRWPLASIEKRERNID